VPLAVEAWNARIPSPDRLAALEECAELLRDAKSAVESLRFEDLGVNPELGYSYRDELQKKCAVALARLDAAEAPDERP
jgi:hypothetical protein